MREVGWLGGVGCAEGGEGRGRLLPTFVPSLTKLGADVNHQGLPHIRSTPKRTALCTKSMFMLPVLRDRTEHRHRDVETYGHIQRQGERN